MDNRVTLRPPLPPVRELDNAAGRPAQDSARPQPQPELQTRVPSMGPITLGNNGFYELQLFPGPLLRVSTASPTGQSVDTSA
jgi:hypothetical protein